MSDLVKSSLPDMAGYDREYGRHSNIPECCIEFYVTEFAPRIYDPKFFNAVEARQCAAERRIGKEFQYRPCRKCLASGNWRQLHICDGLPCEGTSKKLKVKYHLGGRYEHGRRDGGVPRSDREATREQAREE